MKDKIIKAAVENMRTFGYLHCNEQNILTDAVYRKFFASMLESNKGEAGPAVDAVIDELIAECKSAEGC